MPRQLLIADANAWYRFGQEQRNPMDYSLQASTPLPPEETAGLPEQTSNPLQVPVPRNLEWADAAPSAPKVPATDEEKRRKLLKQLLNATACYLLAYQVVTFVQQAVMVSKAQQAKVPGFWDMSGVHFVLGENAWRHNTVLRVYGTGPLLALGLGLVAFLVFWRWERKQPGLVKLLLLWLSFHALNTLFGGLLADTITQSGTWYIPNWVVGVGTWPSTVLAILLGAGQVILGFVAAVPFLMAQDSRTILHFDHRPLLVRYTIMGPWLLGSLLLALSKLPYLSINEGLHYATMGLLLGPLALGTAQQSMLSRSLVAGHATNVSRVLLGLALLGLLAWRLALNAPIRFQ